MNKRTFHLVMIFGITCAVILAILCVWLNVKSDPVYKAGMESEICGMTSVINVCSLHGVRTDFIEICKYVAETCVHETTLLTCKEVLESQGIKSKAVSFKSIANLPEGIPIICTLRRKKGLHAVVVIRRSDEALVIDGQKVNRFPTNNMDDLTGNVALITYKSG
jgi:ABC-type bacteriocin/lantibiotic exporter with double-glycine peptidase domain